MFSASRISCSVARAFSIFARLVGAICRLTNPFRDRHDDADEEELRWRDLLAKEAAEAFAVEGWEQRLEEGAAEDDAC